MRTNIEWEWELLDDFNHSKTARIKVIGGWILNHSFHHPKGEITESMVFIEDKDHMWKIKPKTEKTPPANQAVSEGWKTDSEAA